MPAVFSISNPIAGSICIDESARNYVLAAKGTATTVAKPTVSSPNFVTPDTVSLVTLTGNYCMPILAYRCASRAGIRFASTNSAITDSGTIGWSIEFWVDAAAGTTFDYWIFDLPFNGMVIDSTSAQMRLYREDGALTFDSRMRPMRVMTQTALLADASNAEQSINYASLNTGGRLFAAADSFYNPGSERISNVLYENMIATRWSGDTMLYKSRSTRGVLNVGPDNYGGPTARKLILDVTGY